jgi:hypothetical protein
MDNTMAHNNLRRTVLPVTLWQLSVLACISITLFGCAPTGYTVQSHPATSPTLPTTTVYFYPTRGQSEQQQDRDRYECYLWAVKQSGFDPGQAQLAPHQRIEVTPEAPPGSDTAAGAVGGAIVGSLLAPHDDRGFGLVFGAITGAMMGAASDAARQQQADQIQQQYDSQERQRYARLEKQSRDYERAMTACLEGRGYTVR